MAPFVFDTSGFVSSWLYHHPPDLFEPLWEGGLALAMDDGRIVAPRQVFDELEIGGSDLTTWVKRHKACFIEPDDDVQAGLTDVLAVAPASWGPGGTRNQADPWVVAMARVVSAPVVTYEGLSFSGAPSSRDRQTIMWVCGQLGVACVNPVAVFRDLGIHWPTPS